MAKLIEYDVSNVESSGGGTGVKVPIGLRVARIALCETRDKKRDGTPANDIRVGLDFGPEYDWGWEYVGLGPESDWKLAEFIRACNLKEKGRFDPAKQVDKLVRVKVNPGQFEGNYSPEMGRIMPAQPGDAVGSVAEVAEADGRPNVPPGEVEEASAGATATASDFEPSRESDPEIGPYDAWEDSDLEAEVSDRDLTIPGGRGAKRDKYITALRADDTDFEAGAGKYAEQEETTAADGNGEVVASNDDYDEWELSRLKEEWEARSMGTVPSFRGSGAADRVKAAMVEAIRRDDADNPFN